jgi:hypothetical protein
MSSESVRVSRQGSLNLRQKTPDAPVSNGSPVSLQCKAEFDMLKDMIEKNKDYIDEIKNVVNEMLKFMNKTIGIRYSNFFSNDVRTTGNIKLDKWNDEDYETYFTTYLLGMNSTIREKITALYNTVYDYKTGLFNIASISAIFKYYKTVSDNNLVDKVKDIILETLNLENYDEFLKIVEDGEAEEKTHTTDKKRKTILNSIGFLWCPMYYTSGSHNYKKDILNLEKTRYKERLDPDITLELEGNKDKCYIEATNLLEPLSDAEKEFLKSKCIDSDGLIPYNTGFCLVEKHMNKFEKLMTPKMRARCNVSGYSGTSIIILYLFFIINGNDFKMRDFYLILLGILIWQVPIHHSIYECVSTLREFTMMSNIAEVSKNYKLLTADEILKNINKELNIQSAGGSKIRINKFNKSKSKRKSKKFTKFTKKLTKNTKLKLFL